EKPSEHFPPRASVGQPLPDSCFLGAVFSSVEPWILNSECARRNAPKARKTAPGVASRRCASRYGRSVPGATVSLTWLQSRRSARAAESARLEIVCWATNRGFKSHLLRSGTGNKD